jgi:hypothetical protein
MTTLSTAIIQISNIFGISSRAPVSWVRWMRPAGQIPRGRTGIGNEGDPEVTADHIANLALAVVSSAAGQPARNVVNNVKELSEVHLKDILASGSNGALEEKHFREYATIPQAFGEWLSVEIANVRAGTSLVPGFKFARGYIETCEKDGISMRVIYVDPMVDLSEPHSEIWLTFLRMALPTGKPFGVATKFKFGADLIEQLADILDEPTSKPRSPTSVSIRTSAFGVAA